ncbi:MAG: adenosylmethionine--8-amino-7-oxononanoate transaminase [Bacteroidota bacterium]|nr:adenosylmethionine--8-amino-7-oxononanoate transaminase [Bacteroidota bacterium]
MLWFPYTQMKNFDPLPVVKKGEGVFLHLENGTTLIDGISSWWSVIHGYNHPELNNALINQIQSVSHVMMGGLSNEPAEKLSRKLSAITPTSQGKNYVFFSDSGSVAVEVGLKMAFQFWKNIGISGKNKIMSLKNGYHGDTFKAMEVSDDSDFNRAFSEVLQKGYFLDAPRGGYFADEQTIAPDVEQLEAMLKENQHQLAAFILEPVIQCAGGFHIYSPLYLKKARELCSLYNVLLLFDEIATGFGRTGKLFAADHAAVAPDIMMVGKALTAGYLGHAATIASERVYNSFLDDGYEKAFMHGPTYMGNPLACTVALKSIEIFENENYLEKIRKIESIIQDEFSNITSDAIIQKRILGAMGAIEVSDIKYLAGFKEFCKRHGVWLRPIGKVMYIMPPYIIEEMELRKVLGVMKSWFKVN